MRAKEKNTSSLVAFLCVSGIIIKMRIYVYLYPEK